MFIAFVGTNKKSPSGNKLNIICLQVNQILKALIERNGNLAKFKYSLL